MAFELPFPPFPHDSRDVPFIATPDENNGYTVPSSQYFKKLVGEKYLWTPVSADDPMPTSDAAAQAKLADILAKLSADPATQTTLAAILEKIIAAPSTEAKQDTIISHVDGVESALATLNAKDFATQTTLAQILAKIIAAPATEAKQTALNALIGEAQAAPTANTMLARLKSLEDKIDAITSGTTPAVTQLSGSNIANGLLVRNNYMSKIDTIINAVTVNAGENTGATSLGITNETEVWVAINIDKQPWTAYSNRPVYLAGGQDRSLFPKRISVERAYPQTHNPCVSYYMGSSPSSYWGLDEPTTLAEAKLYTILYEGANISIANEHATDPATITVRVMRIWK